MVGVMSGTSVDGIDAALVRVGRMASGRYEAKVLHHVETRWPAALRAAVAGVMGAGEGVDGRDLWGVEFFCAGICCGGREDC